jgi:hypothetical protein
MKHKKGMDSGEKKKNLFVTRHLLIPSSPEKKNLKIDFVIEDGEERRLLLRGEKKNRRRNN